MNASPFHPIRPMTRPQAAKQSLLDAIQSAAVFREEDHADARDHVREVMAAVNHWRGEIDQIVRENAHCTISTVKLAPVFDEDWADPLLEHIDMAIDAKERNDEAGYVPEREYAE